MSELSRKDVVYYQRTIFNMTNQTPTPDRVARIERVRDGAKRLAGIIYQNCPESRERALALTSLEQSLMNAVASIAREAWGEENA
jgi:hypothetical protein